MLKGVVGNNSISMLCLVDFNIGVFFLWECCFLIVKNMEDKKGSELCFLSVGWGIFLNYNEYGKVKKVKKLRV